MIILRFHDNEVRNMLDDIVESSEQAIPLPNVNSSVLKILSMYCEHHRGQDGTRKQTTAISEWITVDLEMLFEIILAANYLDIKSLLDIDYRIEANMRKGKISEDIRKLFDIAQIKKENGWAEDQKSS
ncbi:hypothetical protein FB446DRAFT_830217 [Lentinula raphanica]|nr:hypothetical protein FB446DRAFT_830217 [Lentinula raphanica]